MTLPRMLQAALDEWFPDGSCRIVQHPGPWRLEQQARGAGVILKVGTTDGFDVAFAIGSGHARSLGAALLQVPHETTPVRRPP